VRYKTAASLGIGTIVLVTLLNIALFGVIGWVAWHFISKYW
jgi:hypothetical protein